MNDFLRDVRIGFRSLRQRPVFLVTAVLTLGLGIGASTAVFSVVESALLRPLPFEDPGRLAMVWGVAGPERDVRGASPIEIADWDAMVDALGPLSRYNDTSVNLSGEGEARQLEAETVEPGYFAILGVAPVLGRVFVPEDDEPGAAGTALISHDLWRTRWAGDPGVIGRTITLDALPFEIVGVMPAGFHGLGFDTQIWVTLGPFFSPAAMADRGDRWLGSIARLEPGATHAVAQAQLDAAAARLEELYPDSNDDRGAMLVPLRDFYTQQSRPLILMVLGGVGLLLLIACANVANLQIVRAADRTREVALRSALGAGRGRVARQMLAESLVLALIGGAAGIILATLGLAALLPLIPDGVLPPYADPDLSLPVLGFGLATALATGLLFGLAPAVRAAGQDAATALRTGARGTTGGPGRAGGQSLIIVAEVAFALVLLFGAGLTIRSLRQQLDVEPGFRPDGVLAARVSLAGDRYDRAARRDFTRQLLERARGLPGVTGATLASGGPLRGYDSATILRRAGHEEDDIRFYFHPVAPGFFHALGIPVLRGRAFTAADHVDAPGVAVVTESFARKLYPGEEAVGEQFLLGSDTATIIGVVADLRYRDLTTDLMDPGEDPDVFFAYHQLPTGSFDLLVETGGDPATLTAPLRALLAELDPQLPLYDVAPLEAMVAAQTALDRMVSSLLGVFGVLALAVAAVGLYGVLAYLVRGRRREIAIRIALGAQPGRIRGSVVRRGLALVGIGLLAGAVGSVFTGRLVAGFLFGVDPLDPVVLAATTSALLLVSALASWLPARQATAIEPHRVMTAD